LPLAAGVVRTIAVLCDGSNDKDVIVEESWCIEKNDAGVTPRRSFTGKTPFLPTPTREVEGASRTTSQIVKIVICRIIFTKSREKKINI
jgi:hypothetical protein